MECELLDVHHFELRRVLERYWEVDVHCAPSRVGPLPIRTRQSEGRPATGRLSYPQGV